MPNDLEGNLLDLYRRLAEQEKRLARQEAQILSLQQRIDEIGIPEKAPKPTVTRGVAREAAMGLLAQHNPEVSVMKGSRADGSGIVIRPLSDQQIPVRNLLAKFYYSRGYPDPEDGWHGWHTVRRPVIDDSKLDFHIFCTWHQGRYFNFIFTRQELQTYVESKEVDSRDLYHFYFTVHGDTAVEDRDGVRDVMKHFERWTLPMSNL